MKNSSVISSIAIGTACLVLGVHLQAATVQTRGAGTAVSIANRSATFDSLTYGQGTTLSDYTEGQLFIGMNGNSWTINPDCPPDFDPFGGANPSRAFYSTYDGAQGSGPADPNCWTIISTTDSRKIFGVEFMYGNGWSTGTIPPWGNTPGQVEWQTRIGATIVSTGVDGDPAIWVLPLGTILGFYDPAGFDELWVRCTIAGSGNTNLQDLSLDNLSVMLTNSPPAPVIDGRDFTLDPATHVPSLTVYGTIAGCEYRMVYTESLTSSVWSPVIPAGGWQAGGVDLTFTDSGATNRPQRCYRVEVR
jgi:hypothetical protein